MFFCGFFAVKNTEKAEALTSATLGSATKIGNGDTMWDENDDLWNTKGYFNSTNTADLLTKLFGSEDADVVKYINDHADTDEKTKYTGATVVTASVINGGNAYGYIVKLGGLDWMVVSMTLADINGKTDQPVLTLYLADDLKKSDGTAVTTKFYNDNTAKKGHSMYSSSLLRKNLLSGTGDYAKLAMFSDSTKDSFATKYLVQPKYIAYQRNQTIYGRTSNFYTCPSDALDDPGKGWNTSPYECGFPFDGTAGGGTKAIYEDWGEDYLWTPSMTETGCSMWASTTCVWRLTTEQRSHTQASCFWRSGGYNSYNYVYSLDSNGSFYSSDGYALTGAHGVRPAIHLNLNAILRLAEPEDTEKDYNGKEQTLQSEKWYKTDIFDDKTFGTVIYKDANDAVTTPKDAGDYTVSITLKGEDNLWAGTSTSKTREAKFTINPKKLAVDFSTDKSGVPQLSLIDAPFEGDTVNCKIHYYDEAGTEDLGYDSSVLLGKTKYQAAAEFDNKNYVPDVEERITFLNPVTPVNVKWDGEGSKVFAGKNLAFNLLYDSKLVKPSLDEATVNAGAEFDGYDQFTAMNAGKYTVNLSLLDKQNYVWGKDMGKAYEGTTDDATIEFEITPQELVLQVVSITPSDWSVALGSKSQVYLDLPSVYSGTFAVSIYAQRSATSKPLEICMVDLNDTMQSSVPCNFVTDNITSANIYNLVVKASDPDNLDAKNYTFKLDKDYTLTVKEPTSTSGILWRLFENNAPAGSMQDDATSTSTAWDKPITYNGNAFYFTVNASGLGYTVDESFGTKGYKTLKKGSPTELSSVSKAGTYITTVRLKDDMGTAYSFSIEWTIDKAKFDLSGVRWVNDGNIPFNEKGMKVELVKESIPAGLTPVYGGVRTATIVGDKGTASVTFTVKDTENYVLPDENVAGSYTFTADDKLTDFEWSKSWEVVAREVPVDWSVGTIELDSGKKINAEALSGGFDEYVEYEYYETDSSGNVLDAEAEPLTEPAITENKIRYYIAKAKIKSNYAGSYVFAPDTAESDLLSPVFEVGNALTAVKLAAKKTTYTYWGSPVLFQFQVTQGAISTDAFDVVYYRGMIRLLGAPTDPDSYRAQVNLKSAYTDRYYIDGVSSFDFKIERGTIAISWNENVKPPVLNLTENQAKYVTYQYRNADGNNVGISAMRTPGTYGVLAKIKDTSKYIFDNTKSVTDWLEFVIAAGDTVTDPSSSLPPFNPSTDPNGSGGGSSNPSTGKIPVGVTLSSTTAHYNGSNQAAQITNTAGLSESAFIVTYNGQTTLPNQAGTYQVEVRLADAYASAYELTGSTSFVYTILASNDASGGNGNGNNAGSPDGSGNGNGNYNGNGGGASGGNASDSTVASYIPVILSGISLVLIVVFGVLTLNYSAAAKAAKTKTKRLAQVTYSFAPVSILALALGLSETNWWIIAGVLMGLALIMGIVAFTFRNKKQKALALLEEEEARVADEKAFADKEQAREEQARRDNEMRMMFAAMQQNYQQPQPQYDDLHVQNLIASTVSALLPGLQQQMALPPASAAAPAPAPAPSPETDALRAQIEKQNEQMAQQQEQMAAQQARMAQQEELLAQILQNQQQAQQSYAVYEEEPVDDISWLGDGDELVSLEESYGNLSDEEKRCYYEIGSYIMSKPRTSQNDGRYAVLFKYRRKTLFKLCIVGDAPVLYYPAENGGRAEIRVLASTLDLAKSVIDRCTLKVDNEMA